MRIKRKTWFVASSFLMFALAVTWFFSTPNHQRPTTKLSYYHWKNSYQLDDTARHQLQAHQLYIKFLDIAYGDKLEVIATVFKVPPAPNTVPVIYLDNRALKNSGIETLQKLIEKNIDRAKYQVLQLDCDWSLATRKKYFTLLHRLKKRYPKLSATIRLHQIKYFQKTGVPPVTRGVLMYYNMSDIQDVTTKNYILDLDIAEKYHVNFENYPLPLDLALPLYHQIRVVRQNKVVMILTENTLNTENLEKIAPNKYQVKQAHYSQNSYLYKDDLLIVDQASQDDLETAAHALTSLMQPKEIIFYTLNHAKEFGYENIENIRRIFD